MKREILNFVLEMLDSVNIPSRVLSPPYEELSGADLGLRAALLMPDRREELKEKIIEDTRPGMLYHLTDAFYCGYTSLCLPKPPWEDGALLLIGPYIFERIDARRFTEIAEQLQIPAGFRPQMEEYYRRVPFILDQAAFYCIISRLASVLFDGDDAYATRFAAHNLAGVYRFLDSPAVNDEDPVLSRKMLEERYEMENDLLRAVAQGNANRAAVLNAKIAKVKMPQRVADPIRDKKNYLIILNTLLRKAAEAGSVHPMHVNEISSRYALKIERITSLRQSDALTHEMVRRYCMLVRNYSLRGYSQLIQKVIDEIDMDIRAELGLKAISERFTVNASYLSTLFRKETGVTLTDFVNKRRVDHALFLLNSTTMQIQAIAAQSGIMDLNYFTRVFKKFVGKTPREYRADLYKGY